MWIEFLMFLLKVIMAGLLLFPLVGGVGTALITYWWKRRLEHEQILLQAQIAAVKEAQKK